MKKHVTAVFVLGLLISMALTGSAYAKSVSPQSPAPGTSKLPPTVIWRNCEPGQFIYDVERNQIGPQICYYSLKIDICTRVITLIDSKCITVTSF